MLNSATQSKALTSNLRTILKHILKTHLYTNLLMKTEVLNLTMGRKWWRWLGGAGQTSRQGGVNGQLLFQQPLLWLPRAVTQAENLSRMPQWMRARSWTSPGSEPEVCEPVISSAGVRGLRRGAERNFSRLPDPGTQDHIKRQKPVYHKTQTDLAPTYRNLVIILRQVTWAGVLVPGGPLDPSGKLKIK